MLQIQCRKKSQGNCQGNSIPTLQSDSQPENLGSQKKDFILKNSCRVKKHQTSEENKHFEKEMINTTRKYFKKTDKIQKISISNIFKETLGNIKLIKNPIGHKNEIFPSQNRKKTQNNN